jgi:hypothetical protein
LAELLPIFEKLRAQGDLPCTYPLHMGSPGIGTAFLRGPVSPHTHCYQPTPAWVSLSDSIRFWDSETPPKWMIQKNIRTRTIFYCFIFSKFLGTSELIVYFSTRSRSESVLHAQWQCHVPQDPHYRLQRPIHWAIMNRIVWDAALHQENQLRLQWGEFLNQNFRFYVLFEKTFRKNFDSSSRFFVNSIFRLLLSNLF